MSDEINHDEIKKEMEPVIQELEKQGVTFNSKEEEFV